MTVLKLKNAGEEMTLAVARVEIVPSTDPKMGAQVKFTDVNGDDLYVGEGAVERQLDRCGVATIPELAGRNVHFSRAANKNPAFPPYWNLSSAKETDTAKTNGHAPVSHTPTVDAAKANYRDGRLPGDRETDFDEIIGRYGECLLAVRQEIAPVLERGGFKMDTTNLVAAAATLFIERNRRGV